MQKYSCLIVEDEPLAAEVLQDYIQQVPFLQYVNTCSDAIFAMDELRQQKIDLVFLDIHLPKLKGLDFIKTLENPPKIIITSAYQEYALQGYELNVLDYLLKPVAFSRFLTAVNKMNPPAKPADSRHIVIHPAERPHLFLNANKKKVKVFLDEILFIESLKEYIRITTPSKSLLVKFQLGHMEALLSDHAFVRIHRSFIVAKDKIDAFNATEVEIDGRQIPIGRNYKELVMAILEQNHPEQ